MCSQEDPSVVVNRKVTAPCEGLWFHCRPSLGENTLQEQLCKVFMKQDSIISMRYTHICGIQSIIGYGAKEEDSLQFDFSGNNAVLKINIYFLLIIYIYIRFRLLYQ